jgi:hypothetical protein
MDDDLADGLPASRSPAACFATSSRKETMGARCGRLPLCAAGQLGLIANPARVNMQELLLVPARATLRPLGPGGELAPDLQGIRVLSAKHPLLNGQ